MSDKNEEQLAEELEILPLEFEADNNGIITAFSDIGLAGGSDGAPSASGSKDILATPGYGNTLNQISQLDFKFVKASAPSDLAEPQDGEIKVSLYPYGERKSGDAYDSPVLVIGGTWNGVRYAPHADYISGSSSQVAPIWIHPRSGKIEATVFSAPAGGFNNLTLIANADGFLISGGTSNSRSLTIVSGNLTLTSGSNNPNVTIPNIATATAVVNTSSFTQYGVVFSSSATNGIVSSTAQGASGQPLVGAGASNPVFGNINIGSYVTGTLGVGNGGTGTSTAFTAGSIVFAGGSGVYNQDNANLFWDDTNNTLGIGTTRSGAISASNPSVRILGTGSTSGTSSFEILNSTAQKLFYVRNDGSVGVGTSALAAGFHVDAPLAPAAIIGTGGISNFKFEGNVTTIHSGNSGAILTGTGDESGGLEIIGDSGISLHTTTGGAVHVFYNSALRAAFESTALVLYPHGSSAGNTYETRFLELSANGANYLSFKAPDNIGTTITHTLPSDVPAAGEVLKVTSYAAGVAILEWGTDSTSIGIGSPITSGTTGSVLFVGSGPVLAQDNANFFWDDTNNTFGIGTTRTGAISATNPSVRIKGTGASSSTSSLEIQDSGGATLLFVRNDGAVVVGANTSGGGVFEVTRDQDNDTYIAIRNATSGTSASASLRLAPNTGGYGHIKSTSDSFTAPAAWASSLVVEAHTLQSGGLWLSAYTNTITLTTTATNAYDIRLADNGTVGFGLAPSAHLHAGRDLTLSAWGVAGSGFRFDAATYTDSSSSGTVATVAAHGIAQPTFAASSVTTYTDATSLYIANAPAAGTNVTITNGYALWVDSGIVRLDGNVQVRTLSSGRVTYAGTNGLLQDSANMTFDGNQLSLVTAGTSGGLLIGSDVQIYRASANTMSFAASDSLEIPSGNLGVGQTAPTSGSRVGITYNATVGSGTERAILYTGTVSAAHTGFYNIMQSEGSTTNSTGTVNWIAGALNRIRAQSTGGTVSTIYGLHNLAWMDSASGTPTYTTNIGVFAEAAWSNTAFTGTATVGSNIGLSVSNNHTAISGGGTVSITNEYGLIIQASVATGVTVATRYGVRIQDPGGAGTLTTQYGLYFEDLDRAGTNYGLYFAGTSGLSRQGIWWNGDVNLYRSAADVLATDDHFNLATSNREVRLSTSTFTNGGLLFNGNMRFSAHTTGGFSFAPQTYTHTSSTNQVLNVSGIYSPASASSGVLYGVYNLTAYDDGSTTGNFTGEIIGSNNNTSLTSYQLGSHTFNQAVAVKGYVSIYDDNSGNGAISSNVFGGWFEINDETSGARITNATGLYALMNAPYSDNSQTRYGLYVSSMPDPGVFSGTITAAIRLAGTNGVRDGILFGSDTNLYRSASDTLKTDDSFVVGANFSILNAGTLSLYESGSVNFSSFVAGTQANDLRYTLPTTQPSTNQVLSASAISGSGPYDITLTWVTPATSGVTIGDGITGSTVGSVLFVGAGSTLAQDNANFYWDDTNNTFGVGTTRTGAISGTNPSVRIKGTGTTSGTSSFEVQDSAAASLFFIRNDGLINLGSSGTFTNSTGQFALSTSGSGAGILLGGDANLYRSSANVLKTDDAFEALTFNKVTITAPASAATLTIADGATLTVSASATIQNGNHSNTNTGDETATTIHNKVGYTQSFLLMGA